METETKVSESKQKVHDERNKFVRALAHFSSMSSSSESTSSCIRQRYSENFRSKFDINTYLSHCRNVINLAFGKVPQGRRHRRDYKKLHLDDDDSQGEYSDDELPHRFEHDLWQKYFKNFDEDMTYILTHARLFGNQTQNMCMLKSDSNQMTNRISIYDKVKNRNMFSMMVHKSEFLSNMEDIIESLGHKYDEAKYTVLNINMTYLTLVILRLSVQDEMEFVKDFNHTGEDFKKLCPHPLGEKLPRLNKYFITRISPHVLRLHLSLVIRTYLNVKDELTKTILQVTCMRYAEWYEMELPMLFAKVVNLYGLDAGRLWDLLCFEKTAESLTRLANVYSNMYQQNVTNPDRNDYKWLPYKISTEGEHSYYKKLSASHNVYLCTILACIVDFKLDMKKSFIRNSEWAKDRTAMKTGLKIAKAFHKFYPSK